jgi:hypothetical protein
MLEENDKTEIGTMIKEALDKLKPAETLTSGKPAEIPIPEKPKSNEELEKEKQKEQEKKTDKSFLAKLWEAIW